MSRHVILGLDVGTAHVKAVVAECERGRLTLRAALREASRGVKKGAVADLAEATSAVGKVLTEAKRVAKGAVRNVYVNVGTPQIKVQQTRGIVAVSRADSEIYTEDINRVVKAGEQGVNLAPNRMIVHTIVREYIVDGVPDIPDPLGLSGSRLEVSGIVVDAFAPHVKHLMRVVELAGGQIGGLILNPVAASRSALSKNQKDLGVVLVDIGAGTTGVAVYEESKLVTVNIFPVGALNITNDLAIGLKIPVDAAELLKLNYGHAYARDVNAKETIELKKFSSDARGAISRRLVAEIIEARLAEILEFVNNGLKLAGKAGRLPGGAVFVGGGAKLPGLTELAREELKLSSQIGMAHGDHWAEGSVEPQETFGDPEYLTALGLVIAGAEQEGWLREAPTSLWRRAVRYFVP